MTNDKQSFGERVAQMRDAAEQLKAITEIVELSPILGDGLKVRRRRLRAGEWSSAW